MPEKTPPTPDEATAVLIAARQKRVKDCAKEIDAVLTKHNCAFEPSMLIKQNAIVPQLQIVPKD